MTAREVGLRLWCLLGAAIFIGVGMASVNVALGTICVMIGAGAGVGAIVLPYGAGR